MTDLQDLITMLRCPHHGHGCARLESDRDRDGVEWFHIETDCGESQPAKRNPLDALRDWSPGIARYLDALENPGDQHTLPDLNPSVFRNDPMVVGRWLASGSWALNDAAKAARDIGDDDAHARLASQARDLAAAAECFGVDVWWLETDWQEALRHLDVIERGTLDLQRQNQHLRVFLAGALSVVAFLIWWNFTGGAA